MAKERKPKVSLTLDPDMPGWLQQQAEALDVTMSHIARRAIRAAMNAQVAEESQ